MAMVLGGTYEIPVAEGLLNPDFVTQLKLQDTFNEDSFDREYNSKWGGDAERAFFSSERIDRLRVLLQAEQEYSARSSKSAYYILGVDVGRLQCTTEVCVFKVTPQPQGASIKSLVNIYTLFEEHFEKQAIEIKKLYYKYRAKRIAIDANGIGVGLIDEMILSQVDSETNDVLPPFGIYNDDEGRYKKFKTPDMENDVIYMIKAKAPLNTEAYSYAQAQLVNGKIRFLIDEVQAKSKLMDTKVGQNMSTDERNEYLRPYIMTTILREQMLSLREENEGTNIILKTASKSTKKDKFSAFIYGLYYIKQEEDRRKKHKAFNVKDFLFFS